MKTISNEQILEEFIGKNDTPKRKVFENELKADVLAYRFRALRKKKHLTQKQNRLKGQDWEKSKFHSV